MATFLQEQINDIVLDMKDDWQMDIPERTCSVMFTGLEDIVCNFFTVELGDEMPINSVKDWLPGGYLDSYAVIDPIGRTVECLYFKLSYDGDGVRYNDLTIVVTDTDEKKLLFDRLLKSGGEEFETFISSAAWEVRKEDHSWFATDPDCLQYARRQKTSLWDVCICGKTAKAEVWDYIQADEYPDGSYIVRANGGLSLADIPFGVIERDVSGYYSGGLEEVVKEYPDDWQQIMLECYFEQLQPSEADFKKEAKDFDEAERIIENIIA